MIIVTGPRHQDILPRLPKGIAGRSNVQRRILNKVFCQFINWRSDTRRKRLRCASDFIIRCSTFGVQCSTFKKRFTPFLHFFFYNIMKPLKNASRFSEIQVQGRRPAIAGLTTPMKSGQASIH
jgi:hypothetical protein